MAVPSISEFDRIALNAFFRAIGSGGLSHVVIPDVAIGDVLAQAAQPGGDVPDPLVVNGWVPVGGTAAITGDLTVSGVVVADTLKAKTTANLTLKASNGQAYVTFSNNSGDASFGFGLITAGRVNADDFIIGHGGSSDHIFIPGTPGNQITNSSGGGGGIQIPYQSPTTLTGTPLDGASAVAVITDSSIVLADPGAKLLSIRNNAVEKAAFYLDGTLALKTDAAQLSIGATAQPGVGAIFLARDGASGGGLIQSSIAGIRIDPVAGVMGLNLDRGGFALGGLTTIKIAAYPATVADVLVLADPNGAAGSFAITLPAANATKGQLLTVKVVSTHAARVVTVIRAGADTIEGVSAGQTTTTFGTTANLASATFQSDGVSKWYLIATQGSVT